jgi:hypothetical protein
MPTGEARKVTCPACGHEAAFDPRGFATIPLDRRPQSDGGPFRRRSTQGVCGGTTSPTAVERMMLIAALDRARQGVYHLTRQRVLQTPRSRPDWGTSLWTNVK